MSKFQCPFCSAPKTNVVDTQGGRPFRRYRKCPSCKKRFPTVESHIKTDVEVYINFVATLASDELVDRMVTILTSQEVRSILTKRMQKKAGVQKGSNPLKIFR